jgi:hypothetical protein
MYFHRGERFQQGRGFGGFFSGLFRQLKPLFSMGFSAGKKMLSTDTAKSLGRSALDIGKDAVKKVAVDVLSGKNLKESVNKEIDDVKQKIATKISGSGYRKRKKAPAHHKKHCSAAKKYCLLD